MSGSRTWPLDALPAGTVLFGYEIDALLGRGGFGITYRARDKIDQVFAIKECFPRQFAVRQADTVRPTDSNDATALAECQTRFMREARALTQLSRSGVGGDSIVKVHTFFEANGTAYIVMEFLAGLGFDSLIAANPDGVPAERLSMLLKPLLHALACVHDTGLLHRDIKPGNIILRADGHPVLIDFGAARVTNSGHSSSFTQIYSEGYAPIEQFSGSQQGPYSDIYAFGMTFYRAIGGQSVDAFTRQQAKLRGRADPLVPAMKVGAGRYPDTLLDMIDSALAVTPEDRPQTVGMLLEHLAGKANASPPKPVLPVVRPDPITVPQDEPLTEVRPNPNRRIPPVLAPLPLSRETRPQTGALSALARTGARQSGASQLGATQSGVAGPDALRPETARSLAPRREGFRVDAPRVDASPADAPRPDTPRPDTPRPDAPRADAPRIDPFRADAPRPDVPRPDVPRPGVLRPGVPDADMPLADMPQRGTPRPGTSRPATSRPATSRVGGGLRGVSPQRILLGGAALAALFVAVLIWRWPGRTQAQTPNVAALVHRGDQAMDKKDYREALTWYRQAADQGNVDAMIGVGIMYDSGRGVARDPAQALSWYLKAAERGNALSQYYIGLIYDLGQGVPRDHDTALGWYRKAADGGNADAQFNIGWLYDHGPGVPQDYAQALSWYRKAANQGNARAQTNIGILYEQGRGVTRDDAQAAAWFRKAADQNNAEAQAHLAALYEQGQGVARDYGQAREWYRKAADHGNAEAQYQLGRLYATGEGVPMDLTQALTWMTKAANSGSGPAKDWLLAR